MPRLRGRETGRQGILPHGKLDGPIWKSATRQQLWKAVPPCRDLSGSVASRRIILVWRLESRRNRQVGKPALRAHDGSVAWCRTCPAGMRLRIAEREESASSPRRRRAAGVFSESFRPISHEDKIVAAPDVHGFVWLGHVRAGGRVDHHQQGFLAREAAAGGPRLRPAGNHLSPRECED